MQRKAVSNLPIDSTAVCWECSYPLKGLLATAKCPECGLGIRYSIAWAKKQKIRKTGSSVKATNILIGVTIAYWFLSFLNIVFTFDGVLYSIFDDLWLNLSCYFVPNMSTVVVLLMRAGGIRFKWGAIIFFTLSAILIALGNYWIFLIACATV